jgi:hypothetical protein
MGFFYISINFLIDKVPWCRILELWNSNSKKSLHWDLFNEPSRPDCRTPRSRIPNPRPFYLPQIPTELCWNFQLSRCYSGWKIGDKRTNRRLKRRKFALKIKIYHFSNFGPINASLLLGKLNISKIPNFSKKNVQDEICPLATKISFKKPKHVQKVVQNSAWMVSTETNSLFTRRYSIWKWSLQPPT